MKVQIICFIFSLSIISLSPREMTDFKRYMITVSFKKSPIEQLKKNLIKVLSKKEYASLDFNNAIIHNKINLNKSRNAHAGFIDSIYSSVPLLKKGSMPGDSKHRDFINLNLLFNRKSMLKSDLAIKSIITHSFIPIDFIKCDVITIEFGNWEILPAIDLESSLEKF